MLSSHILSATKQKTQQKRKKKIKNWEIRKKKHTRSGGEFSGTQDGDPTTRNEFEVETAIVVAVSVE